LRFHWLDAQSFWNDEGNSARLSERSLRLILAGTASDVHPPFYYVALRGWRELVGESAFALRSLSAFAGVGVVALTAVIGRIFYPRRTRWLALVAALLIAINPAHVYYSQELRMYTWLPLWALLATGLFGRRLARPSASWRLDASYALALAAGLYTHYFFPVVLAIHGAVVLLWPWRDGAAVRWARVGRWLVAVAAALLLYAPWLPVALRPLGGNRGVPQPAAAFGRGLTEFWLFGRTLPPILPPWLSPLLALLFVAAAGWLLWRRQRTIALWLLVAVPPLALLALDATDPTFYKFSLLALPPLALLVAGAFAWRTPRWVGFAALGGALLIGGGWLLPRTVQSLNNLYSDPAYARADYRGMAQRIAAENRPNAAVILNAPNQWEVFTYYHRDGAPVYPLPLGWPDPATIDAELQAITADHDRLYALFWGDRLQDPDGLVESWLNAHLFRISAEWVGDVRFVQYAVPSAPAATMETPLAVTLGESIRLDGYTLTGTATRPGDVIELTLFWQATEPVATRYKVFAHLLDDAGRLVSQQDSEPLGGLAPTTQWAVGAAIVDKLGVVVPPDIAAGQYTLVVGMYNVADASDRLPIGDPPVDALPLAQFTIARE
jgi:hypothetical protein